MLNIYNHKNFTKKKMKLRMLAIIFMLVSTICATEENSSEEVDCDSLAMMVINSKDNNLKNFIEQHDQPTKFSQRNDSNEMCLKYLYELITKVEHHKEAEARFLDETGYIKIKRGKQRKTQLKPAFHFKY